MVRKCFIHVKEANSILPKSGLKYLVAVTPSIVCWCSQVLSTSTCKFEESKALCDDLDKMSPIISLRDILVTVKAAPHERVIRTGQP